MKKLFKNDAKSIVDALFDAKLFKDNVTRDDMNTTEEFICDMMDSKFKQHQKRKKNLMDMQEKCKHDEVVQSVIAGVSICIKCGKLIKYDQKKNPTDIIHLKPPIETDKNKKLVCDVCGWNYSKTAKGTICSNPLCGR